MDIIFIPLLSVLFYIIKIYAWVVIASVILTWLVSFNVINTHSPFILTVMRVLFRLTEPVLSKIRRFLPFVEGIDFSPVVLILILWFFEKVVERFALKIAMVGGV